MAVAMYTFLFWMFIFHKSVTGSVVSSQNGIYMHITKHVTDVEHFHNVFEY